MKICLSKILSAIGILALTFFVGTVLAADDKIIPDNSRGVDVRVDYTALMIFGPWDDRNYQLTKEDLEVLPQNDRFVPGVPAFFKVQKRKEMAAQGFPLGRYYPREVDKEFLIRYGGLLQNGVLKRKGLGIYSHPDPKNPPPIPLWATDPLPKSAPVLGEAPFDSTLSDNETTIEFHPTNPNIVIAGSNGVGGQRMSFSSNGGATWGNSGALPNTCCDPSIEWTPLGDIALTATLGGNCGSGFCTQVFWSFNNGQNWQGPVNVSTDSSDKEFIHMDKSPASPFLGRAYLTWHQGNVMMFARSTAMPVEGVSPITFAPAISFAADPHGIGSDITTDSAGRIYYLYSAFTDGPSSSIRVLRSDDGGVNFVDLNGAAAGLSNEVYNLHGEFDMAIPAMETRRAFIYTAAEVDNSGGPFDGRVYVAFTDENAAAGSPGNGVGTAVATHAWIQVRYSDDLGATWNSAATPHSVADQTTVDRFQPWLDVDSLGNVHIGFQDTRNSGAGLRDKADWYYAVSTDGGMSWIEETRVSSMVSQNIADGQEWGDYNGLSVSADNAVVGNTWTDNRIVVLPSTVSQRSFVGLVENIAGAPTYVMGLDTASTSVCAGTAVNPINVTLNAVLGYTGSVTLSTPGLDGAVFPTANFNVNPLAPSAIGASSVLNLDTSPAAPAGTYVVTVAGTDGSLPPIVRSSDFTVDVLAGAPATASLISPANAAIDVATSPVLSWSAVAGAESYVVEVATDAGFTSIVDTSVVTDVNYALVGLLPNTEYFWRVRASNICGDAAFSAVRSFTTANEICFNGSVAIPDNNIPGIDNVLAGLAGNIEDMNVSVTIDHTWVGDLVVSLAHTPNGGPAGTPVVLIDRPGRTNSGFGCNQADIDAILDDEAMDLAEDACAAPPALSGSLIPNNLLSAFDGQDFSGDWTLNVSDRAGGDMGNLVQWCLMPTLTPLAVPESDLAVVKAGPMLQIAGQPISYTITVTNNGPDNASSFSITDLVTNTITGTEVSCLANGTASCGTNATAGNNLSFTGASLNAGAGNSLVLTVTGTVNPAATGLLSNTVTLSGVMPTDNNPGNNSSMTSVLLTANIIFQNGFE